MSNTYVSALYFDCTGERRPCSVDHPYQGTFVFPVGKSGLIERESGDFEDHEQDSQHGDQPLNPRAKSQDLLLQLEHVRIENVDRHDWGR